LEASIGRRYFNCGAAVLSKKILETCFQSRPSIVCPVPVARRTMEPSRRPDPWAPAIFFRHKPEVKSDYPKVFGATAASGSASFF